jgi:7-cyano-7-deazaguanine synthase
MVDNKAVVLLSGGIDSSTALAIARSERRELYALSFNYGQRHKRELDSARMVAAALGVQRHLVISFDLREFGGSALTSDMEVPKDREELISKQIPVTYVPARNTIFLSFALAWAEVLEADTVFIGANQVDYSGYPDCRPEYLAAFEAAANLATKVSVEGRIRFKIRAPLISMKKSEIIRKGTELGLDYSLTWSCYDPQPRQKVESKKLKDKSYQDKISGPGSQVPDLTPCGRCDSCLFRAKGFQEAGMEDPLTAL